MGGGFKVERMQGVGEEADLQAIGAIVKQLLAEFQKCVNHSHLGHHKFLCYDKNFCGEGSY